MDISYVISVSCGTGCYRHIQINKESTFFELHTAIIDAFEFFDDHAHAFFLDNRSWSDKNSLYSPVIEDEENFTTEYRLEEKALFKGDKFKYIFDFGEEWVFDCKVLQCNDKLSKEPIVIKSKGQAPLQYGDESEFDNEDEDCQE